MKWWCSATGEPWTWAWRPYPGVWIFVGLLVASYYLWVVRPAHPRPSDSPEPDSAIRGRGSHLGPNRRAALSFSLGVLAIWLSLDWPIGPLGAGYLASVHAGSYILLSLVAPALLLLGLPRELLLWAAVKSPVAPVLRFLARPLIALAVFNLILFATHVPDVVDTLMPTQLGAFAVDLGWLLGGFTLWWAVLAPSPEVARMSPPLQMAYLFAATLLPTIPSAFLTFASYPLYGVYELAPRVTEMSAQSDQQVAGLMMKIIGDLPLWFGFGMVFFRWAKASEGKNPTHPGAPYPSRG